MLTHKTLNYFKKCIFSIYRTNSSLMAFPQNNIIIHSATVAKYINELVIQYNNDENTIVFNG